MLAATFPLRVTVNHALIATGLDGTYVRWWHKWRTRSFSTSKSLQENVGFSHREDVAEALKRVHVRLRETVERSVRMANESSTSGAVRG